MQPLDYSFEATLVERSMLEKVEVNATPSLKRVARCTWGTFTILGNLSLEASPL
jgi:hypothetical protein